MTLYFNVRNFVLSPVLGHMAEQRDIRFVMVSPKKEDGDLIREQGYGNVVHETAYPQPDTPAYATYSTELPEGRVAARLERLRGFLYRRWHGFDSEYLDSALWSRFCHINNLGVQQIRLAMTEEQRKIELADRKIRPKWKSMPCLRSRFLFRSFFRLRFSRCVPSRLRWIDHLFDFYKPELLLMSRLQAPDISSIRPYMAKAADMKIPVLGIVESWDHGTTKGPLPPGCNLYLVGSERMKNDLLDFHGIPDGRIRVLGHPFHDNYKLDEFQEDRESFLSTLGLAADQKLVVFGTNALAALNRHEPSIARHLVQQVKNGVFGAKCSLYIRTHPGDTNWQEDFGAFHDPPNVIVSNASSLGHHGNLETRGPKDDIRLLINLMKHASVVINTAGSLALDASAFDTPVIYIAFDGDLSLPPADSISVRYGFNHLKPIVDSGGVWMVNNCNELDEAVAKYIEHPSLHAEGRQVIRDENLEPFDGHSSERLVSLIVRFAMGDMEPAESKGLWDHKGIS